MDIQHGVALGTGMLAALGAAVGAELRAQQEANKAPLAPLVVRNKRLVIKCATFVVAPEKRNAKIARAEGAKIGQNMQFSRMASGLA
eukprot:gene26408-32396_t